MTERNALDDKFAPTVKSLKFETAGDTYSGIVVSTDVRQATEFGTGRPMVYDDGTPRPQIIITLETNLRDANDPDDDGTRSLYVKGWGPQRRAFNAAVQAAGGSPEAGDRVTVTYTGYGERPPMGGFASKLYEYRIDRATQPAVLVEESETPPSLQPAAPAVSPEQAAKIDTARKLAATGLMSAQQIAETTGLPLAVVNAVIDR